MPLISGHIVDPFRMLRSFTMQSRAMNKKPADRASYTAQYEEPLTKYVHNEHRAKHQCLPVITSGCISIKISALPQWLQDQIFQLFILILYQA